MNILFVCTGNVCRSPMAEGFLKHEASRRGLNLGVRSTGTHAWNGRAATPDGRRTMQELGVAIDDHRAEELSDALVDWSDLVIGLAFEHSRDTVRDFPQAAGKSFTLKEFNDLLPKLPECNGDPKAWVAAAHAARVPIVQGPETDVDDPLGERVTAYRRVAREIQELIAVMAEGLERKCVGTGSATPR